jgi:hypothetical protein
MSATLMLRITSKTSVSLAGDTDETELELIKANEKLIEIKKS